MRKSATVDILVVMVSFLAIIFIAQPLFALGLQGSAGNTIIRNQATVTYADAAGNGSFSASSNLVSVTVTTINVAPSIGTISPSPGNTGATGATQIYQVEVISNSNGPGTISLSGSDGTANNITLGAAPAFSPASTFLGSSIIDPSQNPGILNTAQNIANNGTITFNIPNDGGIPTDIATTGGATGNAIVNALKVGDTVYIYSGTVRYGKFSVTVVTDNAPGGGTTAAPSSITLQNTSGGALSFTPQYGWMIVESQTVAMTVTQGTVTVPANPASWITTITGDMGGQTGTGTVTTNAGVANLSVAKFVRNVTVPVVGGGTTSTPPINGGGVTFYQSSVSGKPGDVMEYLFVITNSGAANATKVVATDAVPVYTKLRSSGGAYGIDNTGGTTGTFAVARRTGNSTDQSLKVDGTAGSIATAWGNSTNTTASSTMTFYLGNGSNSTTGGTIANTEIAYVIYRVTID